MAGSKVSVVKTAILPLLFAGTLYLLLTFVLLPLYRRHRASIARYSQYAPLTSTLHSTTSIFSDYIPEALRPHSIKDRLGHFVVRRLIPFMFRIRHRGGGAFDADGNGDRRDSLTSDEDGGLFDEESGERMVGFDMNEERRGRSGATGRNRVTDIQRSQALQAALEQAQREEFSDRRLSRELEEGFIDDSGSEASEEGVTVGRRRVSMSASR